MDLEMLQSSGSVEERIKYAVRGKGAEERLDMAMQVVGMGLEAEERWQDVVAEVWELVVREEWWRARYRTLDDFKAQSGMEDSVREVIERRKRTATLKRKFEAMAAKAWKGNDVATMLGAELMPKQASKRFLEVLRALARRMPDSAEAVMLLTEMRDDRLKTGRGKQGFSKERNLRVQDVEMALVRAEEQSGKRARAIEGGAAEESGGEKSTHEGEWRGEKGNEQSEDEMKDWKECGCVDWAMTEGILKAMNEAERKNVRGKIAALLEMEGEKWGRICHRHMRRIGSMLELQTTRLDREGMVERVMAVQANSERLDELMVEEDTYRWFRMKGRPEHSDDRLGPFKYAGLEMGQFCFDSRMVWERYGGAGTMESFLEDGNVVVRGVFDWIVKDAELMGMVDLEFEMYLHHLREQNGVPNYGWCRNMWHSLVQQAMRQDPVFYALNVAARPDKNWRLISFPYYTKYAMAGDSTGFRHIDLNIRELLELGRGRNTVQTGVSMDDESEDGCTEVVPGFHRRIEEWWGEVRRRGEAKEGLVQCVKESYRKEDEERYGEFVPVVCKRGDVRMTMGAMIHGSTGVCKRRRRVVHPWLVGVNQDHEGLDMKECGSWEEVSGAHRNMWAMKVGPTGQSHRFGVGEGRFAGSIEMRGMSGLGDALVGARRWDSEAVLMERDLVLGSDEGKAWKYVERVRSRMKEEWRACFKRMVGAEVSKYGEKAYFNTVNG